MYDIITLGSATVDVFVKSKREIRKHENHLDACYHLGEKVLIDELFFTSGGSATNTATGFSRLGLKTGCVCSIGNDNNGLIVVHDLKEEKVDFLGTIKKGVTGFSVVLAGEKDRTLLVYKGVNNELKWEDIRKEVFDTKCIYLSTMLGDSLKTMEKVANMASKQGIMIVLNTSNYLAIKGIKKIKPLLECADILILNREEAMTLSKKKDIKQSLIVLSSIVKDIVVITDGEKPVYAIQKGKIVKKSFSKIRPVDTTGAGDAFSVGFIYGIMKNKSILESITYGHRTSVSVLQHVGAKNNLPYML